MEKDTPLYNSRITQNYLDYLSRHHPDCDIDGILSRAGIARYEVEDPAHWFTQDQVNRLHDILVQETGNPDISRDVGREAAQSASFGIAKQYVLGMMTPASVYMVFGRLAALYARNARIDTRRLGPKLIEITATPEPGTIEKPYQCRNRLGSLESVTFPFFNRWAEIEHPECIHEGGQVCRYLVHIPKAAYLTWRRTRNMAGLTAVAAAPFAVLFTPPGLWLPMVTAGGLVIALLAWIAERLEKKGLLRNLQVQGEAARGQIDEMKIRANHAQLVQEIGAAASSIRDQESLIRAVLRVMHQRLDFDRAMFMLAEEGEGVLTYSGGYGYSEEEETNLRAIRVPLETALSGRPLSAAFPDRFPMLLGTPEHMTGTLPPHLAGELIRIGIQDCICAPLLYERETLGLLIFHHSLRRPLTQSDLTLLEGVASHTALSIANVRNYRMLEESERNFRELVQGANSVILRADPNGRVIFINAFARDLFGFSEEDIIGQEAVGTILPDEEGVRRGVSRLLAGLQSDRHTNRVTVTRNLHRNGREIWIAWTYRPLFAKDGTLREILCIGNDVTELRTAQKEQAALASRLERARRMEAVGTLAGGVAHELNNILSGIVSYPELLLMDLASDSPLRRPVETIQQAGEKAAGIVQDMLLLSRRGVSATEPLDVGRLVRMYMDGRGHRDLVRRHANIRVELSLVEDLPPVPGSREHLLRVFQSLVQFGFQAMPEGGTLRLTTEHAALTREYIGYEPVKPGEYVLLRVSDEGPALEWDHLERIFEPFYAKKMLKRPGTGLGLPVVWGIVKDHGGFVDVQTHRDMGTTITLFLPVAAGLDEASMTVESSEKSIMGRGETVLVVDDLQEQRGIAEGILKRLNYQPVTLESGEAAVAHLKEHEADLVILDMVMAPGMDGLDTFREILALHPGQKAILVSGYSETDRVREAQRLGVGTYLKKPYSVKMLGRAVREELDREGREGRASPSELKTNGFL